MNNWVNSDQDIAIIGMAGRFPGAENIDQYWQNLRDGVESISFFSDDELTAMGVAASALKATNFVKASPILKDIDLFDAGFFGYSPREAELIDPQHRIFLECAWAALENAGYSPDDANRLTGIFAGTSLSTYMLFNLLANPQVNALKDNFQVMIGNDKDFLSTRVSYHLNLKGPSIDVQTGCSTSLVAIHLACDSLLSYQCDLALAGGVSINVPQRNGYYFQQGGIASPDGHCRTFDAKAEGTIFGSGIGIVVLKRLEDALAEHDSIVAVIKGSAINNDGNAKIGYTAPSVEGQAEVVARALAIADVPADSIHYVEAHGTGTALGDPVEVDALSRVFRMSTTQKQFCAIGSVKTNIGHLDAAAGVAGLIKAALALRYKQIPPCLHFEEPNPKIDFKNSPFYVNTTPVDWSTNGTPRRAGVSSFGIGGTNAHIVLEEAPPVEIAQGKRGWHLLLLSAKTETALDAETDNLRLHLEQHPDLHLGDIAFTLQVGRKKFGHRRMIACRNSIHAKELLAASSSPNVLAVQNAPDNKEVIYMFPGGGAQYIGMGRNLYDTETVFREEVDRCADILHDMLGYNLRNYLCPDTDELEDLNQQMKYPSVALPSLFVVEYALSRLLMSWGIHPQAMIGHSLGEYVAACLAGVFDIKDALALVVMRGKLFEELPAGAMLSVPLSERDVYAMIKEPLSLAAINGPAHCVVSGPISAIDEFILQLMGNEIEYRRLQIDVAAHSTMVAPLLAPLLEFVKKIPLHAPQIPYLSNVTGTWITAEQATDPNYWAAHLRQTVRFHDGIRQLLQNPNQILLEIGPGRTLTMLAKSQADTTRSQSILPTMRHQHDETSDTPILLTALGKLWLLGAEIDWYKVYANESFNRIPLPAYPFERQRYWIEPGQLPFGQRASCHSGIGKQPNIADWFYVPVWNRSLSSNVVGIQGLAGEQRCWLVFVDEYGIGTDVVEHLKKQRHTVVIVNPGVAFQTSGEGCYVVNPKNLLDYEMLCQELHSRNQQPDALLHFWSLTDSKDAKSDKAYFQQVQQQGLYSLLLLMQALLAQATPVLQHLWIVSNNLFGVESTDRVLPEKATLLGLCRVLPQENESIRCTCIDLKLAEAESPQSKHLVQQILAELTSSEPTQVVAYRGQWRLLPAYEPLSLETNRPTVRTLRHNGVYLITGGLGKVGLLLADYLAHTLEAKLILTGRTPFPPKEEWQMWVSNHTNDDEVSQKICKLQALEALGAEVYVAQANVADEQQMQSIVRQIDEQFGQLHGVIHTAGIAGEKTVRLIPDVDVESCEEHFQAKAYGLYVLERVLAQRNLDFCLLFSSNASILGGLGSTSYSAANLFVDAFAHSRSQLDGTPWISANWDGWLSTDHAKLSAVFQTSLDQYAMTPSESTDAFQRLVTLSTLPQVIVSTGDLLHRLQLWVERKAIESDNMVEGVGPSTKYPRPSLGVAYIAPTNDLERIIANVWQEFLGIEDLGIHDNFFELGGNSLMAIKIISQLKQEIGRDVPIVSLFEGPTVHTFAQIIDQNDQFQTEYKESRSRGEQRRKQQLMNIEK